MSHNTSNIGDLIKAFLKDRGLDEKMQEIDLNHEWAEIVGPVIAKHTVSIKMRDSTIVLKLNSAALRHTLSFSKSDLIEKINERLGENRITEISLI